MGLFGSKLRALMNVRNMTFESLATRIGSSGGALHNIATGKQTALTREKVEQILQGFPSPDDIYELASAHLEDECPLQARGLISIQRSTHPKGKSRGTLFHGGDTFRLDDQFERAIRRIRESCPTNEALRKAIIGLAGAVSEDPT